MRLLAPRHRFFATLLIATCGAAPFEMLVMRRFAHRMASARHYLLMQLLALLDSHRLEFDLPVDTTGFDSLKDAASAGRGVLVVTTHVNAGVSRIILRLLYDARLAAVVVSAGSSYPICGAGRDAGTVNPGASALLTVRSRFRDGVIVCAMIDRPAPPPDSDALEVRTSYDSFWVVDPLLRVAVKSQVPVAFVRGSVDGWHVRLDIRIGCGTADEVIRGFAEFMTPQRRGWLR